MHLLQQGDCFVDLADHWFAKFIKLFTGKFSKELQKDVDATHTGLLERRSHDDFMKIHMALPKFFKGSSIVRERFDVWISPDLKYVVRLDPDIFLSRADQVKAQKLAVRRAKKYVEEGVLYDIGEIAGFWGSRVFRPFRRFIDRYTPPFDNPKKLICSSLVAKCWSPTGMMINYLKPEVLHGSRETLFHEDPRVNFQRIAPVDILAGPYSKIVCEKKGVLISWLDQSSS